MYVVQCVCLRRDKFTPDEAVAWVKSHGYSANSIHITPQHIRFRQVDPERMRGADLRSIKIGDIGFLIIAYF